MTIAEVKTKIEKFNEEQKRLIDCARAFVQDENNPLEERWEILTSIEEIAIEKCGDNIIGRKFYEDPFNIERGTVITASTIIEKLSETREQGEDDDELMEDFVYFSEEEENEMKEYLCSNFIGKMRYDW